MSFQSLILPTLDKQRLPSLLRSKPKFLATLRMMFAAPLRSAFTKLLSFVRYKPRFVLLPDAFHP